MKRRRRTRLGVRWWMVVLGSIALGRPSVSPPIPTARIEAAAAAAAGTSRLYLPLLLREWGPPASRQVNAPRLSDPLGTDFARMAIFWFGRVTPTANYADVRVAYTDTELVVYVTVFDRRLWMDPHPSPTSLTAWEAVSLFLRVPLHRRIEQRRPLRALSGGLPWGWGPLDPCLPPLRRPCRMARGCAEQQRRRSGMGDDLRDPLRRPGPERPAAGGNPLGAGPHGPRPG